VPTTEHYCPGQPVAAHRAGGLPKAQALRVDARCGQPQPLVGVGHGDELEAALGALGLHAPSPVLALVGGASGLDPEVSGRLLALFETLCPWLDRFRATVVDGGTACGVMALMGQARNNSKARFPLLGVAAARTVARPGSDDRGAALDPNHTHILLVPGARWGDESVWIIDVAQTLAGGLPSLTLVAGGGEVTRLDVINGLRARRPLVVIAGSGGTADALARWHRGGEPLPGTQFDAAERDLIEVLDLDRATREFPGLLLRTFAV